MQPDLERHPERAVRRAAVEALSLTVLRGNAELFVGVSVTEGITADQTDRMTYAASLTQAWAQLTGLPYEVALEELMQTAGELHLARQAAADLWTRMCDTIAQSNKEVLLHFVVATSPTITAYAQAADVSYHEACGKLYSSHFEACTRYGPTSVTESIVVQKTVIVEPEYPNIHPGRNGVLVDESLTRRDVIGEEHLVTHLAVMTDPRMSNMPSVAHEDTDLDRLAQHVASLRQNGLADRGITDEEARDHERLLVRLAGLMYSGVDAAREYIDTLVRQYLTYHDSAKWEWGRIADLTFDEGQIWRTITTEHNLAAVANALGLSMAETLVLMRTLVAADQHILNRRTDPEKS